MALAAVHKRAGHREDGGTCECVRQSLTRLQRRQPNAEGRSWWAPLGIARHLGERRFNHEGM